MMHIVSIHWKQNLMYATLSKTMNCPRDTKTKIKTHDDVVYIFQDENVIVVSVEHDNVLIDFALVSVLSKKQPRLKGIVSPHLRGNCRVSPLSVRGTIELDVCIRKHLDVWGIIGDILMIGAIINSKGCRLFVFGRNSWMIESRGMCNKVQFAPLRQASYS